MNKKENRSNTTSWLLIITQLFNGISGIIGGIGLTADPSGKNVGLKLEWLSDTPFTDFLIPGIILLLVIGLVNLIGAWLSFRSDSKASFVGMLLGLALIIWIITQVFLVGYQGFLQPLYFGTGLIQFIAGYMLMKK